VQLIWTEIFSCSIWSVLRALKKIQIETSLIWLSCCAPCRKFKLKLYSDPLSMLRAWQKIIIETTLICQIWIFFIRIEKKTSLIWQYLSWFESKFPDLHKNVLIWCKIKEITLICRNLKKIAWFATFCPDLQKILLAWFARCRSGICLICARKSGNSRF
jgi:hypothetical protein